MELSMSLFYYAKIYNLTSWMIIHPDDNTTNDFYLFVKENYFRHYLDNITVVKTYGENEDIVYLAASCNIYAKSQMVIR